MRPVLKLDRDVPARGDTKGRRCLEAPLLTERQGDPRVVLELGKVNALGQRKAARVLGVGPEPAPIRPKWVSLLVEIGDLDPAPV